MRHIWFIFFLFFIFLLLLERVSLSAACRLNFMKVNTTATPTDLVTSTPNTSRTDRSSVVYIYQTAKSEFLHEVRLNGF